MKNKKLLIISLFETIIGIAAIISYFVVVFYEKGSIIKWSITLILAIIYFIMGIRGLINYYKK